MQKVTLQPLSATNARKLPRFTALIGNAIKETRDEDNQIIGYRWLLKNPNVDVQTALFDYHFPITVRDNQVYLYDEYLERDVEIQGSDTINAYLGLIKATYHFTGGAKVGKSDLRNEYTLSSKHATFKPWDGTRRALTILDEFFELDTLPIVSDAPDETLQDQMRLAFVVWGMQHVARLKGMGKLESGDIQYSLFPILLSMDKEIGKSSFLSHLLNAIGSTGETNLEMILNPIQRGRLFNQHQALILNELSPFEVAKNIEKIKEMATLNAYTVDEKFEKAVDLTRETAIIATSNRPAGDFSQHQTERRIQLITIVRKEKPTQFEDYAFDQFWAELAWLVDTMPRRELKRFLRWGTQHTIQPDGDDDSSVFEFIRQLANYALTPNGLHDDNIVDTPDGRLVTRKALVEKGKHDKSVLDSLNIKTQIDAKTGEYVFSDMTFMRRLRTFLSQFTTKTTQMRETKYRDARGYLVTRTVDKVISAKEDLDVKAIDLKYQTLNDVYHSDDKRTGLHRRIASAPVWNGGQPLDETVQDAELDVSLFKGHLVVISSQTPLFVPSNIPMENIDGKMMFYFWLSDDNLTKLSYNETFDVTYGGIQIVNMNKCIIHTKGTWLKSIQENSGLGWLMKFRTAIELDYQTNKSTDD